MWDSFFIVCHILKSFTHTNCELLSIQEVQMHSRYDHHRPNNHIFPLKIKELESIIKGKFKKNPDDLLFSTYEHHGGNIAVFCLSYLVDTNKLDSHLLKLLLAHPEPWTNRDLLNEIPIGQSSVIHSLQDILNKLILGEVFIYIEMEHSIISYNLQKDAERSIEKAEVETVILGPQIAFTESLETNLNLLRQSVQSPNLIFEKITVGEKLPREVRLVYLDSIANDTDVNTMRQRLQDLEIDEVEDITVLKQYVEDSSTNLFPQYYSTELPDRVSYVLKKGKVAVLMEDSPTGFIAPSTFFSFLESTEDLYMRWNVGSLLRFLRMFAMFISISVTSFYVAIVTYQYELIPTELLVTLGKSRSEVPFPPVIEALLIEFLVELIREAGARLPTKVGQTIGIVGGIIVGESAVQAGLASNILIIAVAMSALASYTTPNYLMATSLRIIRFPMIILAATYGIVGIMFGFCFIIIHLLRLTSLGRPYLSPLYPLQIQDFNKVFYHLPRQFQNKRAKLLQTKDLVRYPKPEAKEKKDIDE